MVLRHAPGKLIHSLRQSKYHHYFGPLAMVTTLSIDGSVLIGRLQICVESTKEIKG